MRSFKTSLETRSNSVDWSEYRSYGPGLEVLLKELSPIQSLVALDRLAKNRARRIAALKALLATQDILLTEEDESILELNRWFVCHVEGERHRSRLLPIWYAVINDLAIFLGDVLIERAGTPFWLFDGYGPTEISDPASHPELRPSLTVVLPGVEEYRRRLRFDELIASYGTAVLAGHHVDPDYFLSLIVEGILAA